MSSFAHAIESLSIASLKPYPKNARTHSKKQVRQIADSIARFGFTNPILIDSENTIIAGHGRVEAAKLLSMREVPCIRIEHMTPQEKRAYVLADNKLALNAGWDEEILAEELKELLLQDEFTIDVIGFSIAEVDHIIEAHPNEETGDPREHALPEDEVPARCKLGDVWQLGRHRLVCGNALDPKVIATLMDGHKAQMVFTDPPYNVPVDGHVCGSGSIKHREFAMASGEMSEQQFTQFLQTAFENMAAHSVDGSIHYICMDWRHMQEMLAAGKRTFTDLKNLIVWAKDNGGILVIATTNRFHSMDEAIIRRGRFDHIIEVGLPKLEEIEAALNGLLKDKPVTKTIKLEEFASSFVGYPMSDVAWTINEAARIAVKSGKKKIDQQCLKESIQKLKQNSKIRNSDS